MRGVVVLPDLLGNPTTLTDIPAVVPGPGADVTGLGLVALEASDVAALVLTSLTTLLGRRTSRPDVGLESVGHGEGLIGAQVDLVVDAEERERDALATVGDVFTGEVAQQRHLYTLCHGTIPYCRGAGSTSASIYYTI